MIRKNHHSMTLFDVHSINQLLIMYLSYLLLFQEICLQIKIKNVQQYNSLEKHWFLTKKIMKKVKRPFFIRFSTDYRTCEIFIENTHAVSSSPCALTVFQ
jgi:hypothetical protein